MDDLKKLMENTVIAELARQAGHDPEESIFEQGTDLYHGITYYYEGPIDPEAIGVAAVNALPALIALREENERLRNLLEQCHQFFGEMYSNGVCLPQAGEQALDRVSSRVSAALNQEPTHE